MKSSKDINLDTYNLSLITAKEDVLNPRTSTNWALFAYDGVTNRLKLADSGVGGVTELVSKLHPRRPLYGLCRVDRPNTAQTHIVMIIWVGKDLDEYRRTQCAAHVPAIKSFFKEVHFFFPASSVEDVTEERIFSVASKVAEVMERERMRRGLRQEDREETVGTNYKRTIAAAEIRKTHRENFWAQAEREEEERKEEERRRAAEDRRRRERERVQQEKREAEERERRMNEKLKKIQEQRRLQAQAEAEKHKQEQLKWAQQQQQFEEEMRCRFAHSESVEKAAEAAALVSQRKGNPRQFFRQLSLSSSSSSNTQHTPPNSPRTVRSSTRKFHRSLTDAFISIKSSSSSPSSPCSPNPLSPFFPSTPTSQSPTALGHNTHTQPLHTHSPPTEVSPSISPFHSTQSPSGQTVVSQLPSSGQIVVEIPESVIILQPSSSINTQMSLTEIVESLDFYPRPPTADFEAQSLDQSESKILVHPQPHSSNSVTQNSVCDADQSDSQITAQVQAGISSTQPPPTAPSRPLPALPTQEFIVSTEAEGKREKDDGEKEQSEVMDTQEDEEKARERRRGEKEENEKSLEAWVTAQASMISIPEEEGDDGEMREEEEENVRERHEVEMRDKEKEKEAREGKDERRMKRKKCKRGRMER
ncbi:drebrin-like protein A [Colossoma macropomum]|uniref:drebrin-like protein A n=1 Tax=Colossoma macropomum TaxID=42526 RepID=UPI0018651B41|nr:drebrin-like protein A [Colossoma macropomum]